MKSSPAIIKLFIVIIIALAGLWFNPVLTAASPVTVITLDNNGSNGYSISQRTTSFTLHHTIRVYYHFKPIGAHLPYFNITNAQGNTLVSSSEETTGSVSLTPGEYQVTLGSSPSPNMGGYGNLKAKLYYANSTASIKAGRFEGVQTFSPQMKTQVFWYCDLEEGIVEGSSDWLTPAHFTIREGSNTIHSTTTKIVADGSFPAGAGETYQLDVSGGYWHGGPGTGGRGYGFGCVIYNDALPQIEIMPITNQWLNQSLTGKLSVTVNLSNYEYILGTLTVKVYAGQTGTPPSLVGAHQYMDAGNNLITTSHAFDWPIPAGSGTYQVYAELWQDNLLLKRSEARSIKVDNTPPVLEASLSPPISGGDVYYPGADTAITVHYTATDAQPGAGLQKIETRITGRSDDLSPVELNNLNGAAGKSGELTIDELPSAPGTYTLTIKAADGAGNQTSQELTIKIGGLKELFSGNIGIQPPPAPEGYTNAPAVTCSWSPIADVNIDKYYLKIESTADNAEWTTDLDWTMRNHTQTSYTYQVPVTSNGKRIRFSVKAVDTDGNMHIISQSIISDRTVPKVATLAARFQTGNHPDTGQALLAWDLVNDNPVNMANPGSGIERYETALTTGAAQPDSAALQTISPQQQTYAYPNLSSGGEYQLWIRAVDKAGNTGAWTTSGPFPNFVISGPENNQTVATAEFDAQSREPLAGGKELRYKLIYKSDQESGYQSYTADYRNTAITPAILGDGTYSWYMEIVEFQNGTIVPNTSQTTEVFTFTLNSGKLVSLPLFHTTPGAAIQLSATVLNAAAVTDYHWNFGDGTVINGLYPAPEHRYPDQLDYHESEQRLYKEYPVTLTVTYSGGSIATGYSIVRVENTQAGALKQNETWTGIHHIWGTVIVPENITLIISPGAQVIIHRNPGETGYDTALIVNGVLQAYDWAGIAAADGTLEGGWQGIFVYGTASFKNVWIQHALCGVGINNGADVTITGGTISENQIGIHVYHSSPAISNTEIRANRRYGIKEDGGSPNVANCTFSGNGMNYYHTADTRKSIHNVNGNREL